MDEFSYLSVLLSVILGLAVTQILKGFRGLLLSRAHIRLYWPVIAWAALLLLVCFQHWWATFGMRTRHDWTFLQFAMVLLNVIFIYMVAGLVFPDFFGEEVVDLRENFYAHRGWFFSLGCGAVVVSIAKEFVLDHRLPNTTNLAFQLIFAATLLIGALTRSERYHKGLIIFGSALFVLYIVVLYARMR
jgi:hypothetical protein